MPLSPLLLSSAPLLSVTLPSKSTVSPETMWDCPLLKEKAVPYPSYLQTGRLSADQPVIQLLILERGVLP